MVHRDDYRVEAYPVPRVRLACILPCGFGFRPRTDRRNLPSPQTVPPPIGNQIGNSPNNADPPKVTPVNMGNFIKMETLSNFMIVATMAFEFN